MEEFINSDLEPFNFKIEFSSLLRLITNNFSMNFFSKTSFKAWDKWVSGASMSFYPKAEIQRLK